jgi:hypothetical protein
VSSPRGRIAAHIVREDFTLVELARRPPGPSRRKTQKALRLASGADHDRGGELTNPPDHRHGNPGFAIGQLPTAVEIGTFAASLLVSK